MAKKKKAKSETVEQTMARLKKLHPKYDEYVFECNCEGDPCIFIIHSDPTRSQRPPTYCPNDGKGCRWNTIGKKKYRDKKG